MYVYGLELLLDSFADTNSNLNYWYDVAFEDAQEILKHFTQQDWLILKNISHCKSCEWKKRLVYCFDGENAINETELILQYLSESSCELTECCLDSLRFCINKRTKPLLLNNTFLLQKIHFLACSGSQIQQAVCSALIKKLSLL